MTHLRFYFFLLSFLSLAGGPACIGGGAPGAGGLPSAAAPEIMGPKGDDVTIQEGEDVELRRTFFINGTPLDKKTSLVSPPVSFTGSVPLRLFLEKNPKLAEPTEATVVLLTFGPFSKVPFPIFLTTMEGQDSVGGTLLSNVKCEESPDYPFEKCSNLWFRLVKLSGKGNGNFEGDLGLPALQEDQLAGGFIYPEGWTQDPNYFSSWTNFQNQATYEGTVKFYFLGFFALPGTPPTDPLERVSTPEGTGWPPVNMQTVP